VIYDEEWESLRQLVGQVGRRLTGARLPGPIVSASANGETPEREWLYPHPSHEFDERRSRLAPETALAFHAFSKSVFSDGALPSTTKQLIAVAVAHVTQCPYCIRSHTGAAQRKGATPEEIMEAIWVAAEMRAGGAYAHSVLALDVIARDEERKSRKPDEESPRAADWSAR
jgi:AhpD family alkylhydroperoxidase